MASVTEEVMCDLVVVMIRLSSGGLWRAKPNAPIIKAHNSLKAVPGCNDQQPKVQIKYKTSLSFVAIHTHKQATKKLLRVSRRMYWRRVELRGHPFMTSTKKIRFLTPLPLSTCVHMGRTPPSPLVDVHTRSTWNTHRSPETASTMTYRT